MRKRLGYVPIVFLVYCSVLWISVVATVGSWLPLGVLPSFLLHRRFCCEIYFGSSFFCTFVRGPQWADCCHWGFTNIHFLLLIYSLISFLSTWWFFDTTIVVVLLLFFTCGEDHLVTRFLILTQVGYLLEFYWFILSL